MLLETFALIKKCMISAQTAICVVLCLKEGTAEPSSAGQLLCGVLVQHDLVWALHALRDPHLLIAGGHVTFRKKTYSLWGK